jgi:nitroreductase
MINTLLNHRSIRKFKPETVNQDTVKQILNCGTRASTTGNMQVYSIIVTSDTAIKEKLWEAHFKQNMVIQAPIIITFCADFNRFNLWCKLRKADPGFDNFLSFFTASIDALLVAQNVCIAAEANNLGICYLGTTTYMAEKIIEILKLPKGVIPVTTVVLGHPDESPVLTDRLPLQAVIHENVYKNYSEEDINHYYFQKENSELTKELLKINNKETLAQIYTDKRYTKNDNILFSQSLLSILEKQGFMNNIS